MPSILRSYSHFSLLSALPKVKNLVNKLKELGYTAAALTDEDSSSGFVEFYSACKEKDLKHIFATQLRLPNLSPDKTDSGFKGNSNYTKITLLARDEVGRVQLNEIISKARLEFDQPKPYIPVKLLADYFKGVNSISQKLAKTVENTKKLDVQNTSLLDLDNSNLVNPVSHLILGICGNDSEISGLIKKGNLVSLKKTLQNYANNFGLENIFCELLYPTDAIPASDTKASNQALIKVCQELGILYVASPAPRYLEVDDIEAFKAILGIRDGKRLSDIELDRAYDLPSLDELYKIYDYCPEAVYNTDKVSQQIQNTFETKPIADIFPYFEIPTGHNYAQSLLWETLIGFLFMFGPEKLTRDEWKEQYPYESVTSLRDYVSNLKVDTSKLFSYPADYWDTKSPKDYLDRLDLELKIINDKNYPTYFLVVADFIQYARNKSIVVNTRGSGAGSLVAYLNGITIIDPLLYVIPFERFLNPMRPSTPDFDCDIADDRRDEIIDYVTQKYGTDKVCQIITFGTMLPRMVVRDVGRTLGVSYKKCDRIAKLIPLGKQGSKMTFDQAIKQSQELANVVNQDEDAQQIIAIARKLEGNHRHASVHAAGVIITPTKLTDFTALQWDSDRRGVVCQVDMNSAEKAGMVKMDFLGIRNLSILGNAISLVESRHDTEIDLTNVDLRSKKAFELLAKGRTMGVFQLSGGGITKFLIDLAPSRVEDLMAMVALYRPGPMSNIPEYIKRKHNPTTIEYYVPEMERWMKDSYGILVYQDDLLYTVIELAGYDWAEVDVFRKGVGKKIRSVIDSQHEKFVLGCQSHSGLTAERAEFLWSLMEPFAAYGFNKAHAASYGMVSYWTAYMKGEFTVEFMTTLMTEESNNLDKIAASIKECQELNIEILAPDINQSGNNFTIINEQQIRYGLGSVKNLGSDVIKYTIIERQKHGLFTSFEDFLERASKYSGFNKRSLEALIHAGCLDTLISKVINEQKLFEKSEYLQYKTKNSYVLLRSFLLSNVEPILEALAAFKHALQVESDSLFGFDEGHDTQIMVYTTSIELLSKQQILSNEKEALGLFLTDNPMAEFLEAESRIQNLLGKTDIHLGLITKVKKIFTKSNNLMFGLQVMTPSDSFEAVIFPKNALELSQRLEENKMFWIKGKISQPAAKKKEVAPEPEQTNNSVENLVKGFESEESEFAVENPDLESSVLEYEELPKILVDNLIDFKLGVVPLLSTEKDHQRFDSILEKILWVDLFSSPELATDLIPLKPSRGKLGDRSSLNSAADLSKINIVKNIDPELESLEQSATDFDHSAINSNSSFDYKYDSNQYDKQNTDWTESEVELSTKNLRLERETPKIEATLAPKIIKITLSDGPQKLKNIKQILASSPTNGLVPVQLEIEVAPNEWKRTKKVYFVDWSLV